MNRTATGNRQQATGSNQKFEIPKTSAVSGCRLPVAGCLFIVLFSLLAFTSSVFATPPKLPAFPPLQFHPPKPERFVLPNGLVVFLLEDHELPLIKLDMLFRAGSQYDPPDKISLASLFGAVMSQGGSLSHSPEEIQKVLDVTAAGISFSVGLENGSGSLSCRTSDFPKIFDLFVDLLLHPQFRKDFLELERVKALESLRRMNDDPGDICRREFRIAIYGKDHPYARIATPATVRNISRKDLLETYQHYLKPNVTWMAVSGDFNSQKMKEQIQRALGSWQRGEVVYPPVPPVVPMAQRKVLYIQRPLNQSQIRIGHTGFARHNPDHFAWEVFNELWGGSWVSRLFRIIRAQKGLAYSVGSGYSEPADLGIIVAVCQTRGPQTTEAIRAILEINQDATHAPFSDDEIRRAKESIRNRFVQNFTSSAQIVSQVMSLEFFGYPKDYLDTYPDKISKVTREDLQKVGRTYLHPDQSIILVVGDLSTFEKPLSLFGKPQEIKLIDYAIDQ